MFAQTLYTGTREENYETVTQQLEALITGEQDMIANLSNASALLNQFLDDINWVGFYLWKENELVLGPFQGLPACIRISSGRGVCGTSVQRKIPSNIENGHEYPAHMACDPQNTSEIVIPTIKNYEFIGFLDIDRSNYNLFEKIDET